MTDKYEGDKSATDVSGRTEVSAPRLVKDMNDGSFADTVVNRDGQAGCTVETGTTAVTGNYFAIQILADATFSTLTDTSADGDAMTGFVIPAGITLFGKFTAFTLTLGRVRAYK